jgi:penicillin-binding protein 1A
MDLRTAFAYSVNTIAAKLGSEVGTSAVADMARRLGITTPINTSPSMVLGTSDVRLIDMTRAYASLSAKGVAVAPYGIIKVTTDKGRLLYKFKPDMTRVLIPQHVTAGMTDLLQTAVNTGTGKAASIGRPVAGKTGTTTSNKDGWFMGFSSGITTGVWMGRDDARTVSGLQGGRAPAQAFASFMKVAVAKRAVEQFDTKVTLPDLKLEVDEEAYFGSPDEGRFVDDDGNPLPESGASSGGIDKGGDPAPLDEKFIDDAIGKIEPVDEPVQ